MAAPDWALHDQLPFELPFDPSSSPLATIAAWCIERMVLGDLDEDLVESHFATNDIRTVPSLAHTFRRLTVPLSNVTSYTEVTPLYCRCDAADLESRLRRVKVRVSPGPNHRVRAVAAFHAAPPDVTIRAAASSDAPGMRALELSTPVVDGDVPIICDRGEDYLAYTRLLAEPVALVAELDGVVIAEHVDAFMPARIAGEDRMVAYRHHTRIHPAHQGLKVWPAINDAAGDVYWDRLGGVAEQMIVRVGNRRMRELMGDISEWLWDTEVVACVLDSAAVAAADAAPGGTRPATPADADHIARLSNAAHCDEEVYVPLTADSVRQRLERAPDLYTWSDVLITDNAMIGVWNQRLRVRRGDDPEEVRATVLDSGWLPEIGLAVVEGLLRVWCARLAASGTTHLVVLTSTASPDYDLLCRLATRTERFLHLCRLAPSGQTKGIRLDATTF